MKRVTLSATIILSATTFRALVLVLPLLYFSLPSVADRTEAQQQFPSQSFQYEEHNLADWGIYNGCIINHRIRAIRVLNPSTALLELIDGKKVLMRFMGACRGIKQYGFVYTAKNNMFCVENHLVRVIETGRHCQIKALEPYLAEE